MRWRRNARRPKAPTEPGPRKGRIQTMVVFLGLGIVAILGRAFYLQVTRHDDFMKRSEGQHRTQLKLTANRGDILDRNGQPLAISAPVASVYAVPHEVQDIPGTVAVLVSTLGVDPGKISARLGKKNDFAWIARQIGPTETRILEERKLPGIYLMDEPRRFYPNRTIGGALVGFAGIDGTGLEGVERDYDRYLRGKEYVLDTLRDARGRQLLTGGYLPQEQLSGHSVVTTIDLRIQQVAEQAVAAQVEEMGAKSGFVVVMEPRSGDILAMAQTPAFDPNLFDEATADEWRNKPITDSLEPGSTIKPFLVAAALDAGKITPESIFDGHGGQWQFGKKLIRDVHGVGTMNTYELVKFSSNIGAVQVGQRLGKELYGAYLAAYGFGEPTGVGLSGETGGILHPSSKWGQIHLATMSYGYGLSVTPLQMARGMAALVNGGHVMRPRIVKEIRDARGNVVESFPVREVRRVIGDAASAQIRTALHMVTEKGGTGGRAVIPGFKVGGKTGTAHKVDAVAGGYSKNKMRSSFVGFVPVDDPRLVMYVLVDEPTKAQYGGVVAAPIFRAIGESVLPYLGVRATEPIVAGADAGGTNEEVMEAELEEVFEPISAKAQAWWMDVQDPAVPRVTVPDLRGAPLASVVEQAKALGADLHVEGAGIVVSQRPAAGAVLKADEGLSVVLGLPGDVRRRVAAAQPAAESPDEAAEGTP
ncbi:PASTA domain-containing protein [Myxococcota bacterium]|nr:PASTA domain-containing protein [Myxococcota bacterium]